MSAGTTDVDALLDFPVERTSAFALPPIYEALQRDHPICRVRNKVDGSIAWLLTRYEDVRDVLVHPHVSADPAAPGYPHMTSGHAATAKRAGDFVFLDDPEHNFYRGFLTRDFLVRSIEALRPDIEYVVDHLADAMRRQGPPADLVEAFALPVPSMVICKLLGVPYDDHATIQALTASRLKLDTPAAKAVGSAESLIAYLAPIVAEKAQRPTDDLLSRLAANISAGSLSHQEVVHMARLLVSAGHETTANLISLGTILLLEHPDQLAALLADPSLAASATEEILRFTTIVHATPRRAALQDLEVSGQVIRKGEGLIPLTAAANRDPRVFPDPNRFDIRRNARSHLAFNYGPHHCLGANLARLEMQVVMQRFYPRFAGLRFHRSYEDIRFKLDSLMLGAYELPLAWDA
ncbi:MAG TPA: cytochrome P450 [Nevskiaceae bacterium]|nr:cytochrome P450 [Nevskiaceae bacterium]